LHEPIQPLVLFPSTVGRILLVKLGTQDIQQTLTSMEDVWRQHVMHRPFSYEFLDDTYRNMYESEMQTSRVVSAFTWIAIFLSCLGLFGMASYTFVQRTKEISIRKVLGASTWGILGLLSRDFLVLVGISLLVASPIAYLLMRRWLNDFAYRIDISWWVFVLAGLVAVLLTLVTISIQGLKTARTSPAGKLRSE
ncbi:MAG TPA: ABC transporter permease, partial [Saprospiraceae bacterium]|nr:ABC transporter permease [Saprospiraceae bacterium]